MSITPEQLKDARRLLGWSQLNLALTSGVNSDAVSYFEVGKRPLSGRTLKKLLSTLEAAGVEFIAENGGGAGVRLRKPEP